MAARKKYWDFYVYLIGDIDSPTYIGKGSGRRLKCQERNFNEAGQEIARFYREKDAYSFEVELIAELSPKLNRHKGGNGSRKQKVRRIRHKCEIEMDRLGTRVYAARELLKLDLSGYLTASKVEEIRRVAYG